MTVTRSLDPYTYALTVWGSDAAICPLCDLVVFKRSYVAIDGRVLCHPWCLEPEVVVVSKPLPGTAIPYTEVGRLVALEKPGLWLILMDSASRSATVALPLQRVRHIERRCKR